MNDIATTIIVLIKFLVYSVMLTVGATLLLADPTSPFQALPIVVGIALLAHAMYRDQLRRIEYTIVGQYATLVVVLLVTAGEEIISLSFTEVVTADSTLSILLTLIISAVYFGQRFKKPEASVTR